MESQDSLRPTDLIQRRPNLRRVFLLGIIVLALNSLGCWYLLACIFGCSYCPGAVFDQLAGAGGQYVADESGINVSYDVGVTGVFTPAGAGGQAGFSLQEFDTPTVEEWESMFNEVVEKGYMAIRVPHAPPTYTPSIIVSPTIEFNYYSPPVTVTRTTVSIPVTRRAEYEAAVNDRFPITDGRSHWEVWWVPDGYEPPIPDEPFRLDGSVWPRPGEMHYRIVLGTHGRNCAGCTLGYLFYNGYVFLGPFETTIEFWPGIPGNPPVAFDSCFGVSQPTAMLTISPTVPFTHEHCLINLDAVTHTYTLAWSSSEQWDYTFYTQRNEWGAVAVPFAADQVTLAPYNSVYDERDDEVRILAVFTPTAAITDTMRETFMITATSIVSSDVQATAYSFALTPFYRLDEGLGKHKVYLPLALKNF